MFDFQRNFDQILELAKKNPEILENWRKREVESIISRAPEHLRARLRGLQFQIDCKRNAQKSPMAACISISNMMHESLHKLNAVLNGKLQIETEEEKQGKILSFPIAG